MVVRRVGLLDRPASLDGRRRYSHCSARARRAQRLTRWRMVLPMHYDLATPVTDDVIRRLSINDTVTLQQRLFGIRDATLIALFDRGRTTRLDLQGHAVIHTAPNVKKVEPSSTCPTGYAPVCIGTTTSMRMERFTEPLLRDLGVRIVVGKGGMGAGSLAAFRQWGGVYLAIIG